VVNPFSEAFDKVTPPWLPNKLMRRTKSRVLHGPEFKSPANYRRITEKARSPLAADIKAKFAPVTHTIGLRRIDRATLRDLLLSCNALY